MTRGRRTRTALGIAVLAAGTVGGAAPGAEAGELNVRLHSATFRGTGIVEVVDGEDPSVTVDADTGECDAVVVVGVAAPAVVPCSFEFAQSFKPTKGCTGLAIGAGTLTVYLPTGFTHEFVFTVRALSDEGSGHGFGAEYADPGTGAVRTGYVQFNFVSATCDKRVPNAGIALY